MIFNFRYKVLQIFEEPYQLPKKIECDQTIVKKREVLLLFCCTCFCTRFPLQKQRSAMVKSLHTFFTGIYDMMILIISSNSSFSRVESLQQNTVLIT